MHSVFRYHCVQTALPSWASAHSRHGARTDDPNMVHTCTQVWVRLGVMDEAVSQLLRGVKTGVLRPEYACTLLNTTLALLARAATSTDPGDEPCQTLRCNRFAGRGVEVRTTQTAP